MKHPRAGLANLFWVKCHFFSNQGFANFPRAQRKLNKI